MSSKVQLQARTPAAAPAPYRHDIDGLRAVAILLVVVYHVGVVRVSGGVDAFLMISAFFLTGSFVRRVEEGRPLAVMGQWIRTFKRLLPPAAVVILLTLVVGLSVLPGSRAPSLFEQTWASLFYVENWKLAADATDYYADNIDASPFQHFWSLSVQGQVFILWPLLFIVIAYLAKRTPLGARALSAIVFSVVFALSFAYSVVTTASDQAFAYFDTGARIWEFALGALLAVVLPWIRLSRPIRSALGWIGLLAFVSCGIVIDVQGGFPGYLALWPTLGVAAIVLCGTGRGPDVFVTRALAWRPIVALGGDAYALYLLHWPILVFTLQFRQGAPLTFLDGLAIVGASILGARLLTWLVDDRIRYAAWANASKLRGIAVIALSLAIVAAPTLTSMRTLDQQVEEAKEKLEELGPQVANPGAEVLLAEWNGSIPPDAPPVPFASELESEWGALPVNCSDRFSLLFDDYDAGCSALDADPTDFVVAVIGDSHAQQWLTPLEEIGREHNWQLYSFLKGACSLSRFDFETELPEHIDVSCAAWMDSLFLELEKLRPDLVISVGTRAISANDGMPDASGEGEALPAGQDAAIAALRDMAVPVVLLRDNPRFTFDAYECADALISASNGAMQVEGADSACGVPRDRTLAQTNPAEILTGDGVAAVDMTEYLCPDDLCPAVIGNVFVYLDDNHLTSSYARTLAPMLAPRLLEAISEARGFYFPQRDV